MQDQPNETIYLADYTPPAYLIDYVELQFDLDPEKTRVHSKIKFKPNPVAQSHDFFLHGENIILIEAKINGEPISPTVTSTGLSCDVPNAPFVWEAIVENAPIKNTELQGLYMSNGMYCTQCEAEGFRKITFYPDRPDVMAPFKVTLRGDAPVLLSNGNPIKQEKGIAIWHDPWPKPAYLFALVAGDLVAHNDHYKTVSGQDVELNIWVRPGDEDKCEFGMQALKKSMKWDEDVYGREYDLDIFNIVAVDDFNAGAMENKGLNIFNSVCVLANQKTTTDRDFEYVEAVIAHEYFHNWTGNRITCRDWFQLCLKEGLTVFRDAQFTSDVRSAAVKRISDAMDIRGPQFREDGGPLAHPVRPESFVEINNFYTSTVYEKGAEVISMLKRIVGDDSYKKALDLYFDRHDGDAATIEDWIQVFEDTTGRDLSQFKLWYSQAGTPRLKVRQTFENETLHLDFEQTVPPTPGQPEKKPHVIPVAIGLLSPDGTEIMPTQVVEITQDKQRISFDGHKTPPIPSLLRDFSAPIILDQEIDDKGRAFLLKHDTDPFVKWDCGRGLTFSNLTRMVKDNEKPDTQLLDALSSVAKDDQLDPAFRALALELPSCGEIVSHLADQGITPDPMAIYSARDTLKYTLASYLDNDLNDLFHNTRTNKPYAPDAEQIGQRAFGNRILDLITCLDSGQTAKEQFDSANNMTDELAALSFLMRTPMQQEVLESFYKKWSHERLVIDKWFMLQSSLAKPDEAVTVTQKLTEHSDFNIKNPNRLRSILGGFTQNTAGFHHENGDGYEFFGTWLLKVDALNPMVAARSSTAFQTWRLFDENRQSKIAKQLDRLLEQSALSRDLREMITRLKEA